VKIPFNKPYLTGKELKNISEVQASWQLSGDGPFTKRCQKWLEQKTGCHKAMLTHSCTAALEMSAILAGIKPGDEVIMPSYTFVSTANAFVLRGAIPVFVDIRVDTLNIDETLIEDAITPRTKMIVPVHYAGVSCEMDRISDIARRYNLTVVEDAAQGILSAYKGKSLGSIGDFGTLSFHETKNVQSGEGGALLINNPEMVERAEIIREKGTNRAKFLKGNIDKYTWVDIGSSYLPGEIVAAFLHAQLESAVSITTQRLEIWQNYHDAFEALEQKGILTRPKVPEWCNHNAHMYYLLLHNEDERKKFIEYMKEFGIHCVHHYVPLHSSPAGRKYGRNSRKMSVSQQVADCLVRLPLWIGYEQEQPKCIELITDYLMRN
jgi:dTDP-4-amino-4,6-dideoxygalactose transaminase